MYLLKDVPIAEIFSKQTKSWEISNFRHGTALFQIFCSVVTND